MKLTEREQLELNILFAADIDSQPKGFSLRSPHRWLVVTNIMLYIFGGSLLLFVLSESLSAQNQRKSQ